MVIRWPAKLLYHAILTNKQALPPSPAQQLLVGQGLLTLEASWSHSDTPHSVGLLWTSDKPDTKTSTWQHTIFGRNGQPCPRRDSNPQSQKASLRPRGHRDVHTRTLSKFIRSKLIKTLISTYYLTAEGPKFRTLHSKYIKVRRHWQCPWYSIVAA